ncbi:hypothetical protein Gogos_012904 [Gossypium gossypioides]|uniref:Uncharacterized protein n=1 Tax=Gossypium gossypioides TaxID=34282 RepID=A0A7J9BU03_GOSGO|nr:hypothetical protein [Gossypium gossypioides]
MFVKEEYYINLYVGGKFVRDPHVRYFGEARKKLKEVDRKTNGKVKETVVDETENESSEEQIQAEVLEEVEVMIIGAYLGQMMMIIMMLVEEAICSPLIIRTQQVHTSVFGCCLKMNILKLILRTTQK